MQTMKNITNKDLKRRIIEISYKHKLSHLGSSLTAVDIIDEIFQQKKPDEKFVLSSGHAGLALYCVLEKYESQNFDGNIIPLDAEEIFKHHGVHPDRCKLCKLDCSTGSLGQGLPIAVGMALADRSKNVYCLISDGECSEGSIWEALRIAKEQLLYNLNIYVNLNGYGAYKKINELDLISQLSPYQIIPAERLELPDKRLIDIVYTNTKQLPFLVGQDAHYYTMKEKDYKLAMEVLK